MITENEIDELKELTRCDLTNKKVGINELKELTRPTNEQVGINELKELTRNNVTISSDELIKNKYIRCNKCNGKGYIIPFNPQTIIDIILCNKCDGIGLIKDKIK